MNEITIIWTDGNEDKTFTTDDMEIAFYFIKDTINLGDTILNIY